MVLIGSLLGLGVVGFFDSLGFFVWFGLFGGFLFIVLFWGRFGVLIFLKNLLGGFWLVGLDFLRGWAFYLFGGFFSA